MFDLLEIRRRNQRRQRHEAVAALSCAAMFLSIADALGGVAYK